MTRNQGIGMFTKTCQIDGCTARAEHRLMGVRLCMVCFLRVKVHARIARLIRDESHAA